VIRVTKEILKLMDASGRKPEPGPVAKTPLLVAGPLSALSSGCQATLSDRFELIQVTGLDQRSLPLAPLLVTSLGLQALVQVASGDEGCTTEGRAILSALIGGRTAVALETGLAWRSLPPTAPSVFVSLYRSAEAVLKSAGLRIVRESELLDVLCGGPPSIGAAQTTTPCPAIPEARGVRVLTESIVSNLFPEGSCGTLTLRRGDILTPLARDLLLARKITVNKE
jgi:hypothetical protein